MHDKAQIYLVTTNNRKEGARRCLNHIGPPDYTGKSVFIKPNFNTADICPGSTHNDTLEALLEGLKNAGARALTVGDRSGPADTTDVLKKKGIPQLCEKYGATLMNFETLQPDEWVTIDREGCHWPGGFQVPRAFLNADAVVTTCCLKTHGFGGVFSMSLKLGVGLVPKDFQKLHGSGDMRKMIAEVNLSYTPDFVLMDGLDVFTDGGPMDGVRANADVMLIGSDRIALDAVGLAILKGMGSNKAIMNTPIFEQEQIKRAVELGLGVDSPAKIDIVTDDPNSEAAADKLRAILKAEQ